MHRPLLAFGLAALAIVAHFAIPFIHLTFEDEDGTTHSATHWPVGFADREDDFDPVGGGSIGYTWAGVTLLTLGALAVWLVPKLSRNLWAHGGSYAVASAGAIMTIHSQALWAGRSVSSLLNLFLGTDGPSKKHLASSFSGDYYTFAWAISPFVVLGLAIAAGWLILAHLARSVPAVKGRDLQARRHVAMGQFMLITLAVLFLLPWSVQTLDDNTPAEGSQDQDPFVLSMYDALRLQVDTSVAAKETGEAGLEEYSELRVFSAIFVASTAAAVLASLSGAFGSFMSANQDNSTGRLLESAVYLNALVAAAMLISIALAALLWHVPNDRLAASRAWAPILAIPFCVLALGRVVAIFRDMAENADNLIIDDFPEPIVYD